MNRRLIVLIGLALTALLLGVGGCSEDIISFEEEELPTREVALSGRVLALESGSPIAGAVVAFQGLEREVATDEQGEFKLDSFAPGEYHCEISAEGCLGVSTLFDLNLMDKSSDRVHVDIKLPARSRQVTVRVVNAMDFEPVEGVDVSLVSIALPGPHSGFTIIENQAGLSGSTNAEGQVVLEGLPNWEVSLSVAGADLDEDGINDVGSQLLTLDLRAELPEIQLVPLAPGDGEAAPRIIDSNTGDGDTVHGSALYFEFDQPMNTDISVTGVQLYPLSESQYRVEWTSSVRLEIIALEPFSDWVELRIQAFSEQGLGVTGYRYFGWQATAGGGGGEADCSLLVTDLSVEDLAAQIDYNSRRFELSWSAVPCAAGYDIYARDDLENLDWVSIKTIDDDFDSGLIRAQIQLPSVFDRFLSDQAVTPLAGTEVEICVLPANSEVGSPGLPHGMVTISDQKAPVLGSVVQEGIGNNLMAYPVTLDLVLWFSEFVAESVADPVLVIQEAGGDPAFALDAANSAWSWDPGMHSSRFRFELEPGQDASGDLFQIAVSDLTDLTGNVTPGVQGTGQQIISGSYSFDFEQGLDGWTLEGTGWELGTPTSGPGAAYSGVTCWGTSLTGYYGNSTLSSLVSPEVHLGFPQPELRYYAWISTESCCDHLYVEIDNGTGWQTLVSQQGSIENWQQYTVDLTAYEGQMVQVRFRFRSDSSVTRNGVFLDVVEIKSGL